MALYAENTSTHSVLLSKQKEINVYKAAAATLRMYVQRLEHSEARRVLRAANTDSIDNLPDGWEAKLTSGGIEYFIDHRRQMSTWVHPAFAEDRSEQASLMFGDNDDLGPAAMMGFDSGVGAQRRRGGGGGVGGGRGGGREGTAAVGGAGFGGPVTDFRTPPRSRMAMMDGPSEPLSSSSSSSSARLHTLRKIEDAKERQRMRNGLNQ